MREFLTKVQVFLGVAMIVTTTGCGREQATVTVPAARPALADSALLASYSAGARLNFPMELTFGVTDCSVGHCVLEDDLYFQDEQMFASYSQIDKSRVYCSIDINAEKNNVAVVVPPQFDLGVTSTQVQQDVAVGGSPMSWITFRFEVKGPLNRVECTRMGMRHDFRVKDLRAAFGPYLTITGY